MSHTYNKIELKNIDKLIFDKKQVFIKMGNGLSIRGMVTGFIKDETSIVGFLIGFGDPDKCYFDDIEEITILE